MEIYWAFSHFHEDDDTDRDDDDFDYEDDDGGDFVHEGDDYENDLFHPDIGGQDLPSHINTNHLCALGSSPWHDTCFLLYDDHHMRI